MGRKAREPADPATTITIVVNGEPRHIVAGPIRDVLVELGHDPTQPGIAVAVNDEVVPRRSWVRHRVRPGDRLEIVEAVQGG